MSTESFQASAVSAALRAARPARIFTTAMTALVAIDKPSGQIANSAGVCWSRSAGRARRFPRRPPPAARPRPARSAFRSARGRRDGPRRRGLAAIRKPRYTKPGGDHVGGGFDAVRDRRHRVRGQADAGLERREHGARRDSGQGHAGGRALRRGHTLRDYQDGPEDSLQLSADARTAHRAPIRSGIDSRPPGRIPAVGRARRALPGADRAAAAATEAPALESRPAFERSQPARRGGAHRILAYRIAA